MWTKYLTLLCAAGTFARWALHSPLRAAELLTYASVGWVGAGGRSYFSNISVPLYDCANSAPSVFCMYRLDCKSRAWCPLVADTSPWATYALDALFMSCFCDELFLWQASAGAMSTSPGGHDWLGSSPARPEFKGCNSCIPGHISQGSWSHKYLHKVVPVRIPWLLSFQYLPLSRHIMQICLYWSLTKHCCPLLDWLAFSAIDPGCKQCNATK